MNEIRAKKRFFLTQITVENEQDRLFIQGLKGISVSITEWRDAPQTEKEEWEAKYISMYADSNESLEDKSLI